MSRTERFIEHFEKPIIDHVLVKPEDTLTVKRVYLAEREASFNEVVVMADLVDVDGRVYAVELTEYGVPFDPKCDTDIEDIADRLEAKFSMPRHQVTLLAHRLGIT